MRKLTHDEAIARLTAAHPSYDFSKFVYEKNSVKSTVICPQHGLFQSRFDRLVQGHGCPECGNEKKRTCRKLPQDEAVRRMADARPEFDYSQFVYSGASTKSVVICRTHGEFRTNYESIVGGHGCPKCKGDKVAETQGKPSQVAVAQMMEKRPEFDFSQFHYTSSETAGTVLCKEHGPFEATFKSIIRGRGCPKCGIESRVAKRTLAADEALRRMVEVQPHLDYSRFKYKTSWTNSGVVCLEHGEFLASYNDIVAGRGCLPCSRAAQSAASIIPFDEFVRRARETHGDRYQYIESSYSGMSNYVTAICPDHGEFRLNAGSYVFSQGCHSCKDHGFNPKKRAWLYLLRIEAENGEAFLGYGITSALRRRMEEHDKNLTPARFTCTPIKAYRFARGAACRAVEKALSGAAPSASLPVRGFRRESVRWEDAEQLLTLAESLHSRYGREKGLDVKITI